MKPPVLPDLLAQCDDLKAQLATLGLWETRYSIRGQFERAYETANTLYAQIHAAKHMQETWDAHDADDQRMADIGAYHDMRRDE